MARFRLRLVFNPGRLGSPMAKLGEFTSQAERFLRGLASDLGIESKKGEWIAKNFTNDSVAFDGELASEVPRELVVRGNKAVETITGDRPLDVCNQGILSYPTVADFGRLGRGLDPDDKFVVGIYANGADAPSHWRDVDYKKSAQIRQLLESPLVTHGSVQGTIHAWHTGSRPGFFQVRDLSSGDLVRCVYKARLYRSVHKATSSPKNVVHVYGTISWDRVTNGIVEISVEDIELAEPLSKDQFERLFGSIPSLTGDMSTAGYIEWLRGDAE